MQILVANNARTIIASAVGVSDTTITVAPGTAASFPTPVSGTSYFICTIADTTNSDIREIVYVTGVSGDVFTVTRAQEGTSPLAWEPNDIVSNLFTAGTFSSLAQIDDSGNISANAATATKLATARSFRTNLASTSTVNFDGTANATPGVTGTLPISNGGTGNTIGAAVSLSTPRSIQTNLASTNAATFDGTANVTPGVTGTLPIGNGGTGQTTAAAALTALGGIPRSDVTYYVASTGSDSNNGTSSGTPFLTVQKAFTTIYAGTVAQNITINVGAGTFAGFTASGDLNGSVQISVVGAGSTTIFNTPIVADMGANLSVTNIATTGSCNLVSQKGAMLGFSSVSFGSSSAVSHVFANFGGRVAVNGNYSITASAASFHWWARGGSLIFVNTTAVCAITNTPAFSFFVYVEECSNLYAQGWSYTGATTGGRYVVTENSVIIAGTTTATGRDTFFPGDHNVSDTSVVDQPNVGGRFDGYPDYGFTTLQTINAAGLSTVEFTAIPDCFGQMFVWWSGVTLSATGATFNMQFKPAGQTVYNTTAGFYQLLDFIGTTGNRPSAASALNIQASTATANSSYGSVCLNGFHGGVYPQIVGSYTDCAANYHTVQGIFLDPNWIRNIRLVASGGTFTAGTFKLIAVF